MSDAAASPVSTASSILRLVARKSLRSAGMRSPASVSTTSPTTRLSAGTVSRRPSRRTEDFARQHGADGLERLFRTPFLDQSDPRVDEDDGEDDHGVESVTQQDGDQRRSEEDIDQEVVELSEHAREQGAWLAGRQAVRPVRLETLRSLSGGQSLGRGLTELEHGLEPFPNARGVQSLRVRSCIARLSPFGVSLAQSAFSRPRRRCPWRPAPWRSRARMPSPRLKSCRRERLATARAPPHSERPSA